jgi:thiosulfate/3-mercaptopyruvate sulfurtransferase
MVAQLFLVPTRHRCVCVVNRTNCSRHRAPSVDPFVIEVPPRARTAHMWSCARVVRAGICGRNRARDRTHRSSATHTDSDNGRSARAAVSFSPLNLEGAMTTAAAPVENALATKGYRRPTVLVTTSWLASHLDDPNVRVLESDEDVLLFDTGHVPGAQKIDWHADLNHPVTRDYIDREAFQALLRRKGIDDSTTVVLYGDKNNWWATYTFWVFRLFGFDNVRVLDGGRTKWEQEGRPFVTDVPAYRATKYTAPERDDAAIRAFRDQVRTHGQSGKPLIDVRSPAEFSGETTHMAQYPQEGVLRGGHIPGAKNVPWGRAANADGTFKTADELRAIYESEIGLSAGDDVVTYCRIGERSSHTWFVLTYLLGYDRVRNYDGSWTEWGNSVRLPIAR